MFEKRESRDWSALHTLVLAIIGRQKRGLPGSVRRLHVRIAVDTDVGILLRKWWLYV